ncbi:MAG: hypothetical protein ACTSPK_12345 [Candidatus Heimdallarchaeota archaeon]
MSIFQKIFKSDTRLSSTFDVTIATVKRNLITDWQYKSDIVVQLLWTVTNLVAYGFLGLAVGQGGGDFAPPYSMSLFLLSSSAYWTMFTGNYEETAFCLREEAARGTMGYLITNNVNTYGIMVGRYLSSSLKYFAIFLVTTIPTFAIIKSDFTGLTETVNLLPHTAKEFFMLIPFIIFAYAFMLSTSLFIGSITLLVKQTTTIVKITLYLVRIMAGYFFTLAFFGQYSGWLSAIIVCIPIASGQFAFRKYLIEHNTSADFFGFTYWQVILINIAICAVLLVGSYFFVKGMTKLSRKRGTIEFY